MGQKMKPACESLPPLSSRFPTPWTCRHFADRSEILARDPSGMEWVVIAETYHRGHITAATTADFITHLANAHERTQIVLADTLMALEE